MRTRAQITKDIAAAEKTATGATSALEKIGATLAGLRDRIALGGAETKLQDELTAKAAEQFKVDAATDKLEALRVELEELEAYEARQTRLAGYQQEIDDAAKEAQL